MGAALRLVTPHLGLNRYVRVYGGRGMRGLPQLWRLALFHLTCNVARTLLLLSRSHLNLRAPAGWRH